MVVDFALPKVVIDWMVLKKPACTFLYEMLPLEPKTACY